MHAETAALLWDSDADGPSELSRLDTHERPHVSLMTQLQLFKAEERKPDGLHYWSDFISSEEEGESPHLDGNTTTARNV